MNYKEFLSSVKDPSPLYLVKSRQEYLRQKIQEICEKQVPESARPFDWAVFDLDIKDPEKLRETVCNLVGTARTLPWMSSRRWIFVKNLGNAGGGPIAKYANDPADCTVMVVDASRKPKEWPKIPVIQMDDRVDFVAWVTSKTRKEGFSIRRDAAEVLVELVGDDFQKLETELEKLFLFNLDDKEIAVDSVMELTIEARERDIFELISALARKDREKGLKLLQRISDSGTSPQQIIAMLYWNFRRLLVAKEMLEEGRKLQQIIGKLKIWSYRGRERDIRSYSYDFLARVLLMIRQTDRLLKTASYSPRQQLEKLIVDTCRYPSV